MPLDSHAFKSCKLDCERTERAETDDECRFVSADGDEVLVFVDDDCDSDTASEASLELSADDDDSGDEVDPVPTYPEMPKEAFSDDFVDAGDALIQIGRLEDQRRMRTILQDLGAPGSGDLKSACRQCSSLLHTFTS